MQFLNALMAFFSTPARQAAGWSSLGVVGLALAAGGLWMTLSGGDDGPEKVAAIPAATPTPTPTVTPTRTASPTPTPSETSTPEPPPAATPRPQPLSTGSDEEVAVEPTAEPTAEPTEAPAVVAGGPYCNNINANTPPNAIFGLLTIGGVDAPVGTVVTMLFDGVPGPSVTIAEAGGYKINWSAGGSDCANRVGSAVSISVNGQVFASGTAVGQGDGTPVIRFDVAVP